MKIRHWNISKRNHLEYGMAKYERALYDGMSSHTNVDISRKQRLSNPVLGNTISAWAFTYQTGGAEFVHATFQTVAPAVYLHPPDRFVVTVHDLAPLVYPEEIDDLSTRLQWQFTPGALERADRLIAISKFTKQEINRLLDPDIPIDVVHQGVDHDRFKPASTMACKKYFDLDLDAKHVLVVSSSAEHKNVEITEPLICRIQKERPDVKLLKAGYGESVDAPGVTSTGWVSKEDMPKLYNAADVYVHPSEYEGFGLPILEAMACGVPVVAYDVASIPEIVGDTVSLLPVDAGADEFAQSVLDLIDVGFDHTVHNRSQKFSWKKTVDETYDVYKRTA